MENLKAPEAGVTTERLLELTRTLQKYKAGKARTEHRVIASENWWKLRNSAEEGLETGGFASKSGWLHNVIVSKHADAMDAIPEPVFLPREQDDRAEARVLSDIVPVVLEHNGFESLYSEITWQKLKTGTGVYKVVWDQNKLNGMGDISVERVSLLNIYWEPGVTDIQRSRYIFHTEMVDKELLIAQYPQLDGKLTGDSFMSARFLYDDNVSTEDKATVIECYYKVRQGGVDTLQYIKYVGDQLLYATETDPEMSQRGLYDHGMYPYVFDTLFPIEGSPCGYGFVDLCKNAQTEIDLLKTAYVKNAMAGAVPRYMVRDNANINMDELADLNRMIVGYSGVLGDDNVRRIETNNLDGSYIAMLEHTIQELRETSGNTDTASGVAPSGVTAASAIAALQEASGKGSRDSTRSAYRAYAKLVDLIVELIRQFYDLPRQFRIVGQYGMEQYISYTNQYLRPQQQIGMGGEDMGLRKPVFDVEVIPQKKSVYTQMSQNELALQFFQLGFFNPQLTDQALMCLDMMDFDGKDEVTQKIARNGTMQQKLVQYMQLSLMLAQQAAPHMVQGLSQDIMQTMGASAPAGASAPVSLPEGDEQTTASEATHMKKAREQTAQATSPDKGGVK